MFKIVNFFHIWDSEENTVKFLYTVDPLLCTRVLIITGLFLSEGRLRWERSALGTLADRLLSA